MSGVIPTPIGGPMFDVTGWITYRKIFPATCTITFEHGGMSLFDQQITVSLDAAENLPVWGSGGGLYWNNYQYWSPLSKDASPGRKSPVPDAAAKCKSESPSKAPPTSSSRKSASTSRRFEPFRSRTLARGAQFHVIADSDMRWLYAAYRKGSFDDLPEGLTGSEFTERAWHGTSR